MDVEARRRDADLPAIAKLGGGELLRRRHRVEIGMHDHRGMAAELHRHLLDALGALRRRISLPTGTDPVSETLRITGEAISRLTIGTDWPVRIDSTPAGRPASISAWPIAMAQPGASEAGRAITLLPAASAAAILRAGSSIGKFHADSARQGPTGW